MIIEFHDNDVGNTSVGTLFGRVGHNGTIDYAYQVEMWVQDTFKDSFPITRAYAIGNGKVYAVWKRDLAGKTFYVARDSGYDGEWQLPNAYPGATEVVTAMLSREVSSIDVAARWAAEQLCDGVACAVLLDEEGMIAAWERGPEGPILVARSPRPLPTRDTRVAN